MKNDIDAQFLCKDCDRYNQCQYYHNRKEDSYICKYFEFNLAVPDKESCEDAVSRKDALGALEYKLEITSDSGFGKYKPEIKQILNTIYDIQKKQIQALPPVTPIRPKGEWKYDKTIQNWRCSKCNETPKTLGYVGTKEFMTDHFKFCNHCGADMRGEKDAT